MLRTKNQGEGELHSFVTSLASRSTTL